MSKDNCRVRAYVGSRIPRPNLTPDRPLDGPSATTPAPHAPVRYRPLTSQTYEPLARTSYAGRPMRGDQGRPVIVLPAVGARSSELPKRPLMEIDRDGVCAVVASNGGESVPTWHGNVAAHPHAELRDGGVKRDVPVREFDGEEGAGRWECSGAAYPNLFPDRRVRPPGQSISPPRHPHFLRADERGEPADRGVPPGAPSPVPPDP
ncbi:nitroreductase family deazaflavin-dependent oxidoreductase [Streptomyces fagopyri]|uniref:Nitroreductase family deazaflavin-dependent oxidoreductase n=1 Tax=Streptomyces fagopyri TaxID=2662397 RepID=A0A5Q0L5Q9_9ACTN|nr:nitroreductase family deazaflavin-dependent oxidoreductase [Streptomyces fagopyri]